MQSEIQEISFNRIWDNYYLKVVILIIILILPTLFSQIKGFTAESYITGVKVAEYGSLKGKILFSILFLICIYFWFVFKYKLVWSKYVYFFILYLCLGLLYSQYTYLVFRGLFVAITSLIMWNLFAQSLTKDFQPLKLINSISLVFLCFGFLELFLWAINPKFYYLNGYMANYIGYLLQPNLLAKLLCIAFTLRYFKIHFCGKTIIDILILFSLGTLIILTGSRTSVIAIFVSIVFIHFFFFTKKIKDKIRIVSIAFVILAFSYISFSSFFYKEGYKDFLLGSTLVGRYDVWNELLPIMLKNFWFGSGINSFWNADLYSYFKFDISGIHNGYLQVFQDTGLVGFILLVLILSPILKSLKVKIDILEYKILRISLIALWIYFLIVNFTEGDLGLYRSSLWAVLMTISLVWYHISKFYTDNYG